MASTSRAKRGKRRDQHLCHPCHPLLIHSEKTLAREVNQRRVAWVTRCPPSKQSEHPGTLRTGKHRDAPHWSTAHEPKPTTHVRTSLIEVRIDQHDLWLLCGHC